MGVYAIFSVELAFYAVDQNIFKTSYLCDAYPNSSLRCRSGCKRKFGGIIIFRSAVSYLSPSTKVCEGIFSFSYPYVIALYVLSEAFKLIGLQNYCQLPNLFEIASRHKNFMKLGFLIYFFIYIWYVFQYDSILRRLFRIFLNL